MQRDIAIIGMAGRFPQAPTLEAFYWKLRGGADCVAAVSEQRKRDTGLPAHFNYQVHALLEDIDKFDYTYFNTSLGEAMCVDPHQRLLLESVHEAMENAGYDIDFFNGSRTAVFVGDTNQQYHRLAAKFDPLLLTGTLNAGTAGRVARFFNLTGNAAMVDTACSSSLVALHLACNELLLGEAAYAIASGVKVILQPKVVARDAENDVGIVAPDGKARAFSATATGTGIGEAVVSVLLKPLSAALRDGNVIHAVIKSTAVNQDAARSSSLAAPSSLAQAEVMKQAWEKAGIDPRTIGYIEAHGTGTRLGDPIEIEGMDAAFREYTRKKQFCAVSSVKTNVGHTDSAAGMVGLLKVVLSLQHKELFPSLHFEEPNPFIDFIHSALYVNAGLNSWDVGAGQMRRAGVSSFGLSGTNCHVVLEEAPPVAQRLAAGADYLLAVSAKTKEGLLANMQAQAAFLRRTPGLSLSEVSYTLNAGRKHHKYRFAAIAGSVADFAGQLEAAAAPAGAGLVDNWWIIFSDRTDFKPETLVELAAAYPGFALALQACLRVLGTGPLPPRLTGFVFQYCFYHLLQSLGLATKKAMGIGYGKIIIQVLKKAVSLEEGARRVMTCPEEPARDFAARLRTFAGHEAEAPRTGIIGMGLAGELSALALTDPRFSVLPVPVDCGRRAVLALVETLYLHGRLVQWDPLYPGAPDRRRIALPGYQFLKSRCWLPDAPGSNPARWLYSLAWQPADDAGPGSDPAGQTWVIVGSDQPAGKALAEQLSAKGNHCVLVSSGPEFRHRGEAAVEINYEQASDFARAADFVTASHPDVAGIVFCGGESASANGSHELDGLLGGGLYALLYLTQAFDEVLKNGRVQFAVLTANARIIAGDETRHVPELATLHGFVSAMTKEYPGVRAKCIDLDAGDVPPAPGETLLGEITGGATDLVVGFRKGSRYVQRVEPAGPADPGRAMPAVRPGGVYLVTGGARGIGLQISQYLGSQHPVKLVILGLRNLPGKAHWEDATGEGEEHAEAIRAFRALEATGTEVTYYPVDVADAEKLREVLGQVKKQHGRIDGVIHSAGIGGKYRIRRHSADSFRETLRPKMHGTLNLYAFLKAEPPDFFILFSSPNAIIGTERGSNYSAGNIFLDNFVHRLRREGINAMTIRWAFWRDTGMGKRYHQYDSVKISDALSLSNQEGIDAFRAALGCAGADIIVSKADPATLGNNIYFRSSPAGPGGEEPLRPAGPASPGPGAAPKPVFGPRQGWSDVENAVAQIWFEVLRPEELDLEDNFFAIGGHSLLGVRIRNLLEKHFGVEIEFADLLKYPTIKAISRYIGHLRNDSRPNAYKTIEPVAPCADYDVSPAQRRLWLVDHHAESRSAYKISNAFLIGGNLDAAAFERAIEMVIRRHESLRTTFITVEGQPRQKINTWEALGYQTLRLELTAGQDQEEQLGEWLRQEQQHAFDLAKGPLFRAVLARIGVDQYLFVLTIHHIVSDGWSIKVLHNEILHFYRATVAARPDPLPPLKVQYKDYSAWINGQLSQEASEAHRRFWAGKLQGNLPVLNLGTRKERPRVKTYRGATWQMPLAPPLVDQLERTGAEAGTSLFVTLLGALKVLFFRYTGLTDITLGMPTAGRNHADLENQIGLFLNTIVIRTQFQADDSFRDLLAKVDLTVRQGHEHEAYPFDKLIEELKIARTPGRHPVFDVMVDMIDFDFMDKPGLEGFLKTEYYQLPEKQSKFDLTVYLIRQKKGMIVSLEYNPDVFEPVEMERMAKRFATLLGSITADPRGGIATLKIEERIPVRPIGLGSRP